MRITHHYYIVSGIVDGQKCHEDAQRRRDDYRQSESSVVHAHSKGMACNKECTTYLAKSK